jgi:very-short-patch-repair endonuclease
LVDRQHGVVVRGQLLELGFSAKAIEHRIARGRLHPLWRGVYAVGRPELTQRGRWMAAVLACAPDGVLSHESAAALWEIRSPRGDEIEVSVPNRAVHRRSGIVVHRRATLGAMEVARRDGIPVTSPICTLVDIAARLGRSQLEAAINEADKRDLTSPQELRSALDQLPRRPGTGVLKATLDRHTFRATDSELERRFLALIRRARLPPPQTGRYVGGFKVDFYWPDLGLIVETDGLRYHRNPAQQARDRLRDQAHAAAGLTSLRFTHAQVWYEPRHVEATLTAVARRLRARSAAWARPEDRH